MGTGNRKRSYDELQIGEMFPPLVKVETQDAINRYAELASLPRQEDVRNLHTDDEYAKTTVFAGTVNMGVATVAYCLEALEQVIPTEALLNGGRIEIKAIEPVRAGDTITIVGSVTGKREENGARFVDLEIKAENQHGRLAAVGTATAKF
ncbi:MAG: MaoC family dehydratase [Bacteroidetes bacterium]|nr:MaoC family dehydratase [Bacteroidota bacterium]MCL5026672.1 MaoC family dehydratase [Chloroflexota bacterium]